MGIIWLIEWNMLGKYRSVDGKTEGGNSNESKSVYLEVSGKYDNDWWLPIWAMMACEVQVHKLEILSNERGGVATYTRWALPIQTSLSAVPFTRTKACCVSEEPYCTQALLLMRWNSSFWSVWEWILLPVPWGDVQMPRARLGSHHLQASFLQTPLHHCRVIYLNTSL